MSLLSHVSVSIAYLASALAATLATGYAVPNLEPTTLVIVAGLMVVLGINVHQAVICWDRDNGMAQEFNQMKQAQTLLIKEMSLSRREMQRLRESVADGGQGAVDEQKLMQTLLVRLTDQSGGGSLRLPGPGEAAEIAVTRKGERIRLEDPPARQGTAAAPHDPWVEPGRMVNLRLVADALRTNRVDLYLQPVLKLADRKPVGFECYTRIRDGDGRVLPPSEWIPLANAAGMSAAVDNTILLRCMQLMRKVEKKSVHMTFFCNVSAHSLRDEDFFAEFTKLMERNRPPVGQLVFEMAQMDFTSPDPVVRAHMDQLAELGFGFAVDQVINLDLNIEEFAERGVRYVKVEAEQLLMNEGLKGKSGIVATLRRRLEQASIQLVAEKIEQEGQLTTLIAMGLVLGQGYAFGQPKLSRAAA